MKTNSSDEHWMRLALNLAAKGEGLVEPNPMVGCVLVGDDQLIGAGFHQRFGGPHAEVEALNDAAQKEHSTHGATAFVTLEPCSHFGKTPPCADALIAAEVARVVIAVKDPFEQVAGKGVQRLTDAGIEVKVGVLRTEAEMLLAPYLKRVNQQLPWLIAKWAMTLDGKIATASGDSRWISGEAARHWVHQLRGRMDGILIGSATAIADDPLLTVRPTGKRIPKRLVLDRDLKLPLDSRLATTATDVPVCLAVGPEVSQERIQPYRELGVEVWQPPESANKPESNFDYAVWVGQFLRQQATDGLTNILVEGGGAVFGNLFDQQLIDEVAVFVAPKIVGGDGRSPVTGLGVATISESWTLQSVSQQVIGNDVLIRGRVRYR